MYARILIVGNNRFGEADYLYRLRCAFERNGHAVAHFKTWASKPITADLISTAIKSFRPTLVLWDVRRPLLTTVFSCFFVNQVLRFVRFFDLKMGSLEYREGILLISC